MKKIPIFIISLISLFGFTIMSFAQNYIEYYNLINEAEYYVYSGNDSAALIYYEKAFNCEKPHAKDLFDYALCVKRTDNSKDIRPLLVKSAKNFGDVSFWLYVIDEEKNFHESFIEKLVKIEKRNRRKTKEMRDTLDYFKHQDQIFVGSIKDNYSKTDPKYREFLEKFHEHDSLYQVEFLNYINENGYPGFLTIGTDLAVAILLHLSCSNYQIAKDILYKELINGRILPFNYAMMVDRLECICNGESYYSAYPMKSCLPGKDKILENRKKIGVSIYFQGPRTVYGLSSLTILKLP